jgi:hypothetical protein
MSSEPAKSYGISTSLPRACLVWLISSTVFQSSRGKVPAIGTVNAPSAASCPNSGSASGRLPRSSWNESRAPSSAVAAVPAGTKPLPTLRAAFHQAVPLIEENLPVTERRAPVIFATPALRERALAKSAALVAALTDALVARGVAEPLAALCAQVGMDTYSIAIRRWGADRGDDLHTHLDRAFNDLRLAANTLK